MDAKFISMDDAAKLLGVDKDRLNGLREAGKLRAYRDGASWKFRTEEITKLQETGLPSIGGESSIIGLADEPDDGALSVELDDSAEAPASEAASSSGLELGDLEIADDVGDSIELESEPEMSGIGLDDGDIGSVDEPTVAADEPSETLDEDDDDLVLDAEASGDDAESILLSDAELGESPARPPSTIIGRSELAIDDDDLTLAPSDSDAAAAASDVKLAAESGVLSTEPEGSEVIPGAGAPPSGKFEDLEELEIDLEAESSRILEAEDVAAAQAAQKAKEDATPAMESDLSLAPSDSGSGLSGLSGLAVDDDPKESDVSLTGISSLEVEGGSGSNLSGLSAIELAEDEDDDFVLGDSGSDLTLSGADSGINLMPSDSGISLDDAAALSGASLGSSIDLGEVSSDVNLGSQAMASGELASSEDFLLTPLGEDDGEEEDSSQIIALEAVEEEGDLSEEAMLGASAIGMAAEPAGFAAGPAMVPEAAFSVWNVVGLGACLGLMSLCGVIMVDVVRNIWASEDPTSLTSSPLIDGLLQIFGR